MGLRWNTRPARALTLALVALVLTGAAQAGEDARWRDGPANEAQFEVRATALARVVTGRNVSIQCEEATSWRALGPLLGFDATSSWAVTPFHWDSELAGPAPDSSALFSPRACRVGTLFVRDPSNRAWRSCKAALRTARNSGVVAQGALVTCDRWELTLLAVHVLSHESVHLRGFYDEAHADCLALQLDTRVAMSLGADETLARSMAHQYWTDSYLPRINDQSAECYDGGSLDLFPGDAGWPTPNSYPSDLEPAVSTLEKAMRAEGDSP